MKPPKLDPWMGVIDAILEDDKTRPAKQRHTAKRVWERLKEEHQFMGGYTIVKDYIHADSSRPNLVLGRFSAPLIGNGSPQPC